ncbi:MAG: response regulator [Kofleriaceae bacterium]
MSNSTEVEAASVEVDHLGITVEARRVALVDDDPGFLRAASRWLTRLGMHVVTWHDPDDFARSLETGAFAPYDVVVVDHGMPTPGTELIARLVESRAPAVAVGVSASMTPSMQASMYAAGALHAIDKSPGEQLGATICVAAAVAAQRWRAAGLPPPGLTPVAARALAAEDAERAVVAWALARRLGSVRGAAAELGEDRANLQRRIRRLGLRPEMFGRS